MTTTRGSRGPYGKGIAKREAILGAALELYADSSGARPTLRAIADAVSLSEAGLLHYFASMDELLIAVLEARDRQAVDRYDLTDLDDALAYLASTTDERGLTRLFVDMSVAGSSPEHPAHRFMLEHRHRAEEIIRTLLGPAADDQAVKIIVSAAEGLQLRWLSEPAVDVAGALRRLIEQLRDQPH